MTRPEPVIDPTRPRDLDRATLAELAQGYAGHSGALVDARLNLGEREPVGRLRASALDALAIGEQLRQRMVNERWTLVWDALTHGATVEQIAAATDMDRAQIVEGFTAWANGQHEHGLTLAGKRDELLALLTRGDR